MLRIRKREWYQLRRERGPNLMLIDPNVALKRKELITVEGFDGAPFV